MKPNSSATKRIYPAVKRILIPFKKGIPETQTALELNTGSRMNHTITIQKRQDFTSFTKIIHPSFNFQEIL